MAAGLPLGPGCAGGGRAAGSRRSWRKALWVWQWPRRPADPSRMEGVLGEAQEPLHLAGAFVPLTCEQCATKGTQHSPRAKLPCTAARLRPLSAAAFPPPAGHPWGVGGAGREEFQGRTFRTRCAAAGHFPPRAQAPLGSAPNSCGRCGSAPPPPAGALRARGASGGAALLPLGPLGSAATYSRPGGACSTSAPPPRSCSAPEPLALNPRECR